MSQQAMGLQGMRDVFALEDGRHEESLHKQDALRNRARSGFGERGRSHLSWLIVLAGAAFVMTDAFTNALWFDESFSVAMASHSFAEIWRIGALDVHPVLYYWMLHIVYLLFGQNLVAYRVLTVAGTIGMAVLGVTAVRRDYGRVAGYTFALLSFILPHASTMAVQLRMYSWAAFAIACCMVFALRARRAIREQEPAGAPCWIAFAISSLAAAYLHYFGAMTAFLINLLLLGCALRNVRTAKRQLAAFAASTVAQLALYAPWAMNLLGQVAAVGESYWIALTPARMAQMVVYPLVSTQMLDAVRGLYGIPARIVTLAACALAAVLLLALLVLFIRYCIRVAKGERRPIGSHARVSAGNIGGGDADAIGATPGGRLG